MLELVKNLWFFNNLLIKNCSIPIKGQSNIYPWAGCFFIQSIFEFLISNFDGFFSERLKFYRVIPSERLFC